MPSRSALFGCSSFEGADYGLYHSADPLRGHLAPAQWMPTPAAEIYALPRACAMKLDCAQHCKPCRRCCAPTAMAGWVSDHAAIDRALDTLHVFTVVEIAKIPLARARLCAQYLSRGRGLARNI